MRFYATQSQSMSIPLVEVDINQLGSQARPPDVDLAGLYVEIGPDGEIESSPGFLEQAFAIHEAREARRQARALEGSRTTQHPEGLWSGSVPRNEPLRRRIYERSLPRKLGWREELSRRAAGVNPWYWLAAFVIFLGWVAYVTWVLTCVGLRAYLRHHQQNSTSQSISSGIRHSTTDI